MRLAAYPQHLRSPRLDARTWPACCSRATVRPGQARAPQARRRSRRNRHRRPPAGIGRTARIGHAARREVSTAREGMCMCHKAQRRPRRRDLAARAVRYRSAGVTAANATRRTLVPVASMPGALRSGDHAMVAPLSLICLRSAMATSLPGARRRCTRAGARGQQGWLWRWLARRRGQPMPHYRPRQRMYAAISRGSVDCTMLWWADAVGAKSTNLRTAARRVAMAAAVRWPHLALGPEFDLRRTGWRATPLISHQGAGRE
jgi:hypothetical protein